MATIINGLKSLANIKADFDNATPAFKEIVEEVVSGNVESVQSDRNDVNLILGSLEKDVPRMSGQAISFKRLDVKFTKGDYQTSAKEFRKAWNSLRLEKAEGYNVQAFDLSDETLLASERGEVNIDDVTTEAVQEIMGAYVNSYLPAHRQKALLYGNTLSTSLPALIADTTDVTFGTFGFARGGKYNGLVRPGTPVVRNHYRTIAGNAGTVVQSSDIEDAIKSIKSTKYYGKGGGSKGVVAFATYFTIQKLAKLFADTDNKDKEFAINEGQTITVKSIYGANFIEVEGMKEDLIVFLDASYLNKGLIMRGIENSENQVGMGIIFKNNQKTFERVEDFQGAKMRLFPEERFVVHKLSGLILDVDPANAVPSGLIEVGSLAETALTDYVTELENEYTFDE